MKKRISLIICALVLVLGLAGCSEPETVSYDEATIQQSCENLFQFIAAESMSVEDINGMSEWNQGYFMAQVESQLGVKMDASDLVVAIQGWEASKEECGTYIGHGDYEFTASTTGLKVTTKAEFSEREADLEFSFNEDLELESFTVSAKFEMNEILQKAGLNTLLGMGTVFAVLIFMSFVISLFKYIPMITERKSRKEEKQRANAVSAVEENVESIEEDLDDTELVAVIAAAIAAYEGTTTEGFVVRSIKRRKSNKWNA